MQYPGRLLCRMVSKVPPISWFMGVGFDGMLSPETFIILSPSSDVTDVAGLRVKLRPAGLLLRGYLGMPSNWLSVGSPNAPDFHKGCG